MDSIRRDLRYTFRKLSKSPAFLLAAVLTLALGIGLNAAVFSVVNGLVFQPLPVAAPEELVSIFSLAPGEFMSHAPLSTPDYEHLRDEVSSFAEILATTYRPLALEHGAESRLVLGEKVTPNYFSLLGVEPLLGRTFVAGEDDAPVAVLSHLAWQRRYGSDPRIVGQTVRVDGHPLTVIGVAPKGFTGLTRGVSPELWQPLGLTKTGSEIPGNSGPRKDLDWLWVTGRLASGHSAAEARAEIDTLVARRKRDFPESYEDRELAVVPRNRVRILPGVDGSLFAASSIALAGVALVLLIASANVANMLLARAAGRRQEMATRLSLGASPAAIARQLLTESFVLAALGGGLGLLLAMAFSAVLDTVRLPVAIDLVFGQALDPRVLLFTLTISTLTAIIFGLVPAIDAARTDLNQAIRDVGAGGRPRRQWRRALVVVQIALSLLLLICAGLTVRSLAGVFRIDLGFDADGVVVASFASGSRTSPIDELYDRLLTRVRALPGVQSAGLVSHLPLSVEILYERVAIPGYGADGTEKRPRIDAATVGPGYFETLRIPLRRGRTFQNQDTADAAHAVVVNEAFAHRFWPGDQAIGQELRVEGVEKSYQVVGVVSDGKYRTLGEPTRPFLYLAFAQGRWHRPGKGGEITTGTQTLVARVAGDPGPALESIRRVAREVDEEIAVSRLSTLREALAPALAPTRLAAGLFGLFGLLGLVLAATGTYAVMAYATSQRTREIGIRMALGARRGDVQRLMLREGLVVTGWGVALGLAAAAMATPALASVLYGVSTTDVLTWTSVSLFLAGVAMVASYLPARRAAGVDPLTALRYE